MREQEISDHRCREITTRIGETLLLPKNHPATNLCLVKGIGESTERALKAQGYETMEHLAGHPHWGYRARQVLDTIESRTIHLKHKVEDGCLLGLYDPGEVVFFDIETMGLHDCPLFLAGLLYVDNEDIVVQQILARNIEEEADVLQILADTLAGHECIITYNGKRFDIPFTRQRMRRHDVEHCERHAHSDLMYAARRRWTLPNYKLTTVEREVLGMYREDDVPSSQIPHIYNRYLRQDDLSILEGVLEHNVQDLVGLARLTALL